MLQERFAHSERAASTAAYHAADRSPAGPACTHTWMVGTNIAGIRPGWPGASGSRGRHASRMILRELQPLLLNTLSRNERTTYHIGSVKSLDIAHITRHDSMSGVEHGLTFPDRPASPWWGKVGRGRENPCPGAEDRRWHRTCSLTGQVALERRCHHRLPPTTPRRGRVPLRLPLNKQRLINSATR
jgi:hypothetical protein